MLRSGVLPSKVGYKRSALEGETSRRLVHSVTIAALQMYQFKHSKPLQLLDYRLPAGAVVSHRSPRVVPVMSHLNPVDTVTPCFFTDHLVLLPHQRQVRASIRFLSVFPFDTYAYFIKTLRVTCPSLLIASCFHP